MGGPHPAKVELSQWVQADSELLYSSVPTASLWYTRDRAGKAHSSHFQTDTKARPKMGAELGLGFSWTGKYEVYLAQSSSAQGLVGE